MSQYIIHESLLGFCVFVIMIYLYYAVTETGHINEKKTKNTTTTDIAEKTTITYLHPWIGVTRIYICIYYSYERQLIGFKEQPVKVSVLFI